MLVFAAPAVELVHVVGDALDVHPPAQLAPIVDTGAALLLRVRAPPEPVVPPPPHQHKGGRQVQAVVVAEFLAAVHAVEAPVRLSDPMAHGCTAACGSPSPSSPPASRASSRGCRADSDTLSSPSGPPAARGLLAFSRPPWPAAPILAWTGTPYPSSPSRERVNSP